MSYATLTPIAFTGFNYHFFNNKSGYSVKPKQQLAGKSTSTHYHLLDFLERCSCCN